MQTFEVSSTSIITARNVVDFSDRPNTRFQTLCSHADTVQIVQFHCYKTFCHLLKRGMIDHNYPLGHQYSAGKFMFLFTFDTSEFTE